MNPKTQPDTSNIVRGIKNSYKCMVNIVLPFKYYERGQLCQLLMYKVVFLECSSISTISLYQKITIQCLNRPSLDQFDSAQ